MYTAKITSKGQITIPKEVRVALNLDEGEHIIMAPDPTSGGFIFSSVTMVTLRQPRARPPTESDQLLHRIKQLLEEIDYV